MSGECDKCGEHCLECRCDMNIVQKYFDHKLLGEPPRLRKYEPVDEPDVRDTYGCFCVVTPELEEQIKDMSEDQVNVMADIIADCMVDTYRKITLENLNKIRKEKCLR